MTLSQSPGHRDSEDPALGQGVSSLQNEGLDKEGLGALPTGSLTAFSSAIQNLTQGDFIHRLLGGQEVGKGERGLLEHVAELRELARVCPRTPSMYEHCVTAAILSPAQEVRDYARSIIDQGADTDRAIMLWTVDVMSEIVQRHRQHGCLRGGGLSSSDEAECVEQLRDVAGHPWASRFLARYVSHTRNDAAAVVADALRQYGVAEVVHKEVFDVVRLAYSANVGTSDRLDSSFFAIRLLDAGLPEVRALLLDIMHDSRVSSCNGKLAVIGALAATGEPALLGELFRQVVLDPHLGKAFSYGIRDRKECDLPPDVIVQMVRMSLAKPWALSWEIASVRVRGFWERAVEALSLWRGSAQDQESRADVAIYSAASLERIHPEVALGALLRLTNNGHSFNGQGSSRAHLTALDYIERLGGFPSAEADLERHLKDALPDIKSSLLTAIVGAVKDGTWREAFKRI